MSKQVPLIPEESGFGAGVEWAEFGEGDRHNPLRLSIL